MCEAITELCQLVDKGYLPQPVTQWRDKETGGMMLVKQAYPSELFAKIIEETAEAMQDNARLDELVAARQYDEYAEEFRIRLGMELTDIITACTTALNFFGFDLATRAELQKKVNEKNKERGYLERG